MNYQQPQHARNAKYQTAGKYDEVIAFIGSEAEPYNKIGLQLVLDAKKAEANYKPVLIGKKELAQLPNVRLLPVQNNCKLLSLYQLGELTEAQKTLVATAIAHHTPNVKTAKLYDSAMQETEDFSGYIERIRNEQENEEILAHLQAKNDSQQIKTQPYFDEREVNGIKGIYYIIPKIDKETAKVVSEKEKWTCEPLTLKGEGYTENGEAFYIFEWEHPQTKKPHTEAIPFSDFGKSAGWELMQRYGLKMTNESYLNKLADHFHSISKSIPHNWKVTTAAGWQNGAYILPNGEIIGEPHSPIYFTKKSISKLGYTTKGTLESWKREIAGNIRGNYSMMIGIATAFTAPLLEILGTSSFGVHLFGDSSKGKSTTIHLANSIYGDKSKLVKTWNSTPYAIQQEAVTRNDGFLTLDEIGQAKNAKDLEAIAYDIFNETGKMQGRKEGGNREVNHWKITALSTGEKDLETQLRMQGVKIHTGQLVRLINLPIYETCNFHQFPNAKAHADYLNEAVSEHYGVVGRSWITFISQNNELIKQTYKQIRKKWLDLTENMSGQVQRVAGDRFATMETALQLATHLTGWSEEENSQAILKNFLDWKETFGEKTREETKIIETLLDWINENEASFIEYPPSLEYRGPNKIAGYRILANSSTKTDEYFFMYPKAFKETLAEFPLLMACTKLHEAGILQKHSRPEKGYEFLQTIPKTITNGKKIRAYKIMPIQADDDAS
ncbi:DUF927 domain-containing protein [Actinobacillus lignieresii]|uniref:Primase n=1 Tax=Actinobacillus lignieresii TaxID=720 RepID=A0A380TXB0_ACTLI|nr:DUF927 domain-containing protein [Actinobacillus lignieresii]SUT92691.1 primase [Actinobacillus lignieresii]